MADWSNVRYIFLDGDAGDDSHLGYIDAPAGTVFTPAQTTPVAVKTTHRVNQIRVPVGAGRMCVVLVKPRTGFATYDLVAAGDGLGSEDRSGLSDYSLHTRGSDLTNSLADRQQLGYGTAVPGPNPDGSFTVVSATPGPDGWAIKLTGAAFADPWALGKYRMRIVTGGVTNYAPVKWGDVSGSDTSVVTLWFAAYTPPSPGDSVWLESPGAVLLSFSEAASATSGAAGPSLSTAGISLTNVANVGCSDDPVDCIYCGLVVLDGGLGVFTSGNRSASVLFTPNYTDESGTTGLTSNPGLVAPVAALSGASLDLSLSHLVVDGSVPSSFCDFNFDKCTQFQSNVLQGFSFGGCPRGLAMNDVVYGQVNLRTVGRTTGRSLQGYTPWGPVITLNPDGTGGPVSGEQPPPGAVFAFTNVHALQGAEPPNPGFVADEGAYTVNMDLTAGISAGTGLRVVFDETGLIFVDVSYDSLETTGFEVVGGQKVVCRDDNQVGYPGGLLPCPRGTVMRRFIDEDVSPQVAGDLVAYITDTGVGYFTGPYSDARDALGILLTPAGTADPTYAVVGTDAVMVLHLVTAYPGAGVPVYETGLLAPLSGSSTQLGTTMPVGPSDGNFLCLAWHPVLRSVTSQLGSNLDSTDSSTWVDIGAVDLPPGRYQVDVQLEFTADAAAGIQLGLYAAGSFTDDPAGRMLYAEIEQLAPSVAVVLGQTMDFGSASTISFTGATNGFIRLHGTLLCTVGGGVGIHYRQNATNAASTIVYAAAFIQGIPQ